MGLKKAKNLFLNLGLFFIALFLTLFCIEVYLTLFDKSELVGTSGPKFLYRYHPQAGYALNYNFHSKDIEVTDKNNHWVATHTNKFGFRSREDIKEKNDILRVMMLGDSFTFGYGVRDYETFPWILDRLLNKVIPGADVLNAGITGASNIQEIAYFNSEGIKFSPHLVVLQVYMGNDISQNWNEVRATFRYGIYQVFATRESDIFRIGYEKKAIYIHPGHLQQLDEYLYDKFHLYRLITDRLLHIQSVVKTLQRFGLITTQPLVIAVNNVRQPAQFIEQIDYTCDLIKKFADQLRENKSQLIVLMIPSAYYKLGKFDLRFLACLKDRGIDYIDPTFYVLADKYYYLRAYAPQGHFTFIENQIVAAQIFKHLCEKYLKIPEETYGNVLDSELSFHSPLTSSKDILVDGKENDEILQRLSGFKPLDVSSIISDLRYDQAPSSKPPEELDLNQFRHDIVNADFGENRIYFFPGDWGAHKITFDIDFNTELNLKAVKLIYAPVAESYRATFMVIKEQQTNKVLAISSDLLDQGRSIFVTKPIGKVKNLKIELYRPSGTKAFALRGFTFYGEVL